MATLCRALCEKSETLLQTSEFSSNNSMSHLYSSLEPVKCLNVQLTCVICTCGFPKPAGPGNLDPSEAPVARAPLAKGVLNPAEAAGVCQRLLNEG